MLTLDNATGGRNKVGVTISFLYSKFCYYCFVSNDYIGYISAFNAKGSSSNSLERDRFLLDYDTIFELVCSIPLEQRPVQGRSCFLIMLQLLITELEIYCRDFQIHRIISVSHMLCFNVRLVERINIDNVHGPVPSL